MKLGLKAHKGPYKIKYDCKIYKKKLCIIYRREFFLIRYKKILFAFIRRGEKIK